MASRYSLFGQKIPDEMQEKQAERVKQSQKLLKELYHDELNPSYSAPVVRGLKILILVSIITIMVFSSVVSLKYNNFIAMQEEVFAKQGMLEAALQRRLNLFGNLAKLTLSHAILEDTVFTHVADVRKELVDKLNLNDQQKQMIFNKKNIENKEAATQAISATALTNIVSALGSSDTSPMGQLLAVAEQYPDIKSAETYKHMMSQMVEIEDRITARRLDLLAKIQLFNTEIARFPWYYLAKLTRFSRIQYFEADKDSHVSPIIDSDTYVPLMPLNQQQMKLNSYAPSKKH